MNIEMFLDPLRRVFSGGYQPLQVVVELLLIGISVNWCASVLHGTRGTRLLRGLLVVLVAATLIVRVLAGQLGWTRLELLYHYFVIGLGFIALVAFQPELRRALIQAGEMRLLRRRTQQDKVVAALVESAGFLSRNRYGALIAIQREVGLANWAEHGAQIDAEVNSRLLNTLFFPNSPLHDLGVIIRGTRILAANCQFPTAESGDVDARLGSRHRAAVGLSQESDALVLAVSEETGTISIAERGRLSPMASLEKLEQELVARLGGDAARRKTEPRRDWHGLWLVWRRALIVTPLSLLIWLLADQASMAQIDGVPVELRVVAPLGFAADVVAPRPAAFALTLRGSKRETDWFASATREQPLRLDWLPTGAYARPGEQRLSAAELAGVLDELPALASRGVRVTGMAPDELRIAVDELVPVELTLMADAGSHTLTNVRFDPPTTRALMRKSDADKLTEEQKRLPVRLDERIAGVTPNEAVTLRGVPLSVDQRSPLRAVRLAPDSASVTLQVSARKFTRKLERVDVRLAVRPEFAQRYVIEPRDPNEWLASVELEGERSKLEGLRPEDIRALVEISSDQLVGSADYRTLEVRLLLPGGIQLVGRAPTVQVKITPREKAAP